LELLFDVEEELEPLEELLDELELLDDDELESLKCPSK
jgi:hypothetical protein